MRSVLDREAALDRVGGDAELLAEIARLFLEEYPSMIAAIRQAVASGNALALEHSAHSLKGSVANFAADSAWQKAFELEKIGRSGDLTLAPGALRDLEAEFAELAPELRALAEC